MELLFLIGLVAVGLIVVANRSMAGTVDTSTTSADGISGQDNSIDDSGPGFYLNQVDATSHGAMFKMGDDDDGPGFYL